MSLDETSDLLTSKRQAASQPGLSPRQLKLRRFLRHKPALASLVLLLLLGMLSLAAPAIEAARGLDANAVDLFSRSLPPSDTYWLGTDELGRDLLLRLLYGGQVSLAVGLLAAFCAALLGTCLGLLAGYYGGRFDAAIMRLADTTIALPLLPLLIVLAAIDLTKLGLPPELANSEEASFYRIVILIALVGWTVTARLVRGAVLSLKRREYVLAPVVSCWCTCCPTQSRPSLSPPLFRLATSSCSSRCCRSSALAFSRRSRAGATC